MTAAATKTALVIGGTRGIGRALVSSLLARDYQVYTTIRGTTHSLPPSVHVIPSIDLSIEGASASTLISNLQGVSLDLVLFSAGTFQRDTLTTLSWQDSMSMYATCALAPAFIASALFSSNCYNPKGANFLLLTSEGGSVGLRTKEEGGGNYGHHASKAAANMMGKLLSLDMEKRGINVLSIHPGFMRTEMTANVGYDEYWDVGGAVEPEVAAESLLDFESTIIPSQTGQFWAPRGPRDIGEATRVMGPNLPTPLQLPW